MVVMSGTETSPSDLESIEKRGAPDEEQKAPAHHDDAPDGGLRAWLVVLGVWCSSFCSFGWINSESLISSRLTQVIE